MTTVIDLHSFAERDLLVDALAMLIATELTCGINSNGRATLAVSGGSTPVDLFVRLANTDLAWSEVDICLVDERWVEHDDPDSNERLVKTHLLQNKAASAHFVGMKTLAKTASDGEAECAKRLHLYQPCDVLVLGMGDDGHTASLFPRAQKLAQAVDMQSGKICMGIAPSTAPHERMTLTLPAILAAKQIILHITGQNKKEVLNQALAGGAPEEMPIRFIINHLFEQKKPLPVYWAK